MDIAPITRPDECALALAIPWERTGFLEQLDPSSPHEFAKCYREDHGGQDITPEALWSAAYEPREATPIARVLEDCAVIGVEVDCACTLTSLAELSQRKRVIILAAHWRSGLLQLADLRSVPSFAARLATEPEGTLAELRRRVVHHGHGSVLDEVLRGRNAPASNSRLICVLQEILRSEPLEPSRDGLREVRADASHYQALNRKLLNEACPEELTRGFGLELCDGTHDPEAVAVSLMGRFSGIMDMVVCNSYLLAAAIKQVNPDCLLMVNREKTSPVARLLLAREVLKSLARKPGHYVQVSLQIREHLRPRSAL